MRYDLVIDEMTWSYSRLNSFSDCPYKWFLTYLYRDEHGKPIMREGKFFAEYGSFMHKILQMYLAGELKKKDLATYYVLHFAENVRAKAPNRIIYQNYYQQGFFYLSGMVFPEREILGVEMPVEFQFAGKPWVGFIDLVSRDHQLILTDHKSRDLKPRSKRSKPTIADKELDDYFRQLYVYSAAIKQNLGCYPDALEFNCFRTGTIIQEPFRPEKLDSIEKWAGEQIETITKNDNWKPCPDFWRCHYLCGVCHECEFFKMS